jgi:hypothetical protein
MTLYEASIRQVVLNEVETASGSGFHDSAAMCDKWQPHANMGVVPALRVAVFAR